MKVINILIAIGVLIILGACGFVLYGMMSFIMFAMRTDFGGSGPTITGEFYLLLTSTSVLAISSIPTIIYQIKKIIKTTTNNSTEDLIDKDEFEIETVSNPISSKLLYNSTKFYAFALLTELLLVGNKVMDAFSRINSTSKWLFLTGFVCAIIIAFYYLFGNKNR